MGVLGGVERALGRPGEVERVSDAWGTGEESARKVLAERLRELRKGSGRTYAGLARRIGVSGSTLHRYCTGQTVPAEFAPVERLARFCGRSGEEREALHRLWLRADAERVERQESGASASDTGAGGDRGAGESPDTTGPGESPTATGTDESPTATGTDESPTATGTKALSGSVPPAATAVPRVPALPPEEDKPAHAPRSPALRRWALALGVCALATVALATLTGFFDGPTRLGRHERQPPVARPGAVPFTWTGDDHVWRYGCGHAYLVARPPAAVPPPPAEADAESWATALGAVHAGETGVRITLQGADERAVVLEALRIRVVERRAPAAGRVHRMSSGCGGALTPRMFDVDLDAARPVARSVPGNDTGEPIAPVSFPYRVSATDPEVLLITGRTVRCDCDWVAELSWSSGGRSGTVRMDDGGRPFRTSGAPGRPVHDYDFGARRWMVGPEDADGPPGAG
ncbi:MULTISPECIES: helix-turn-helix transcriptional regulator [unclassified Streptomyces]|uniref:helix-turn-helix domain-containing protein n=1 Tax=unclassified Streptomyces TaxID=2593676 RepID=UPI00344CB087